MTPALTAQSRRARPFLGVVVRSARRLAGPALALLVLRLGIEVVGPWPTAVATTAVAFVWGLRTWAEVERRLDRRRATGPPPYVVPGPRSPGRDEMGEHVAFARGLVAVSARYLALCEDQADIHTRMEGWR